MPTRSVKPKNSCQVLPDIHPLVRLLSLLVFVVAAGQASPALLLAGLVILLSLFLLFRVRPGGGLLRMLYRLRWLFLAIIVVYGWWTPGTPVFPALADFSPVVEGLESGFYRVCALLLIVCSVYLTFEITPREKLLAGLLQLAGPFAGQAARERFAVRVLLVMETVPRVQPLIEASARPGEAGGHYLARAGQRARRLYDNVLASAGQAQAGKIAVGEAGSPAAWQWLIPVMLLAVFACVY